MLPAIPFESLHSFQKGDVSTSFSHEGIARSHRRPLQENKGMGIAVTEFTNISRVWIELWDSALSWCSRKIFSPKFRSFSLDILSKTRLKTWPFEPAEQIPNEQFVSPLPYLAPCWRVAASFWNDWRDSKKIAGCIPGCHKKCIMWKHFSAIEIEVEPVHCSTERLLCGWWQSWGLNFTFDVVYRRSSGTFWSHLVVITDEQKPGTERRTNCTHNHLITGTKLLFIKYKIGSTIYGVRTHTYKYNLVSAFSCGNVDTSLTEQGQPSIGLIFRKC